MDSWSVYRLLWWLVAGAFALQFVLRHRDDLKRLSRSSRTLFVSMVLWTFSLLLSSVASPSPLFTLVMAVAIIAVGACSLDLAIRMEKRCVEMETVVFGLVWVCVAFLGIIFLAAALRPSLVYPVAGPNASRLMGGSIASVPFVSMTAATLGLYLALTSPSVVRSLGGLILVSLGVGAALASQVRSSYICIMASAAVMLAGTAWLGPRKRTLGVLSLGSLSAGAVLALMLVFSQDRAAAQLQERAYAFLLRDEASLRNVSGRAEIADFLLRDTATMPLGCGYVAGPRTLLLSAGTDIGGGIVAARIGSAHNMYLEICTGAGIYSLGLLCIAFLATAARLLGAVRSTRRGRPERMMALFFLATLVALLVEGVVSSEAVLPFNQACSSLFLCFATALAVDCRLPDLGMADNPTD